MTVPINQIHNGYNNILSYPLEHDDKIYILRGDPRNGLSEGLREMFILDYT